MLWLKRVSLAFLGLLLLLVVSGIIIVWLYGDRMKAYVMDTVRSNITTQMHIGDDISISFWKDFPRLSVGLHDVWIQDAFRTDTLLKAEALFVQLDVMKVLTDRLSIEGIRVSNGHLHLHQNAKGDWNYKVWKEYEDDGTPTDLSIDLLALETMDVLYRSDKSGLVFSLFATRSKMSGRFTDDEQNIRVAIDGQMHRLATSEVLRAEALPFNLIGLLKISDKGKTVAVEGGNAHLAGNEFVWDMVWQQKDTTGGLKLNLQGSGIRPEQLLPLIWPTMPEGVRNMAISGKSDINISIEGPLSGAKGLALHATWNMRSGGMTFRNIAVTRVDFEASVAMPDLKRSHDATFTFKSFALKTPKGNVSGKGTLRDPQQPHLQITTKGRTRLEEIFTLMGDSIGMSGKGTIAWDIDFSGSLGAKFKPTKAELKQMHWSGQVQFSDVILQLNRGIPTISDLHGQLQMEGKRTDVSEFSGKLGHIEFDGQLGIEGLREVLTDPMHPMRLTGAVSIKELDVMKLPTEWSMKQADKSGDGTTDRSLSLQATVDIGKIVFKGFSAEKVKGDLSVVDRRLDVNNMTFQALGGTVSGDLNYLPTTAGAIMNVNADMKRIDISRMLKEWDDFGQQTITSKHLKGTADAKLLVQIPLDTKDDLIRKGLTVQCDLRVAGGELIGFEPLNALSKFIEVDELKHVRFDTIINQFSMANERLIIPHMQVRSSILNVEVYGEHGLDQELDYHVNLLLNDLIRRKAKKQKFFEGHEIIDEKGKTRLYLWIRGKPGNIKVGFDKKEVRLKVKDELRKEGSSIKQMFRDEFGGKKAGSGSTDDEPIKLRLEEITPPADDATIEEKPKKKKRKGLFSKDDEEELEGQFELEKKP